MRSLLVVLSVRKRRLRGKSRPLDTELVTVCAHARVLWVTEPVLLASCVTSHKMTWSFILQYPLSTDDARH